MSKNIYQRILAIMEEVKYIKKTDKKVNGQYTYVAHDAIAAEFHSQFVKHGVVAIPTILELNQEGNRTTVKLQVEFVNADTPEDRFAVVYVGQGIDQGDKGAGKALSYAYKYALLKTFCLETGDNDPEFYAKSQYVPTSTVVEKSDKRKDLPASPLTDAQINWLNKKLEKFKVTWTEIGEGLGVYSHTDLLQSHLKDFMNTLNERYGV